MRRKICGSSSCWWWKHQIFKGEALTYRSRLSCHVTHDLWSLVVVVVPMGVEMWTSCLFETLGVSCLIWSSCDVLLILTIFWSLSVMTREWVICCFLILALCDSCVIPIALRWSGNSKIFVVLKGVSCVCDMPRCAFIGHISKTDVVLLMFSFFRQVLSSVVLWTTITVDTMNSQRHVNTVLQCSTSWISCPSLLKCKFVRLDLCAPVNDVSTYRRVSVKWLGICVFLLINASQVTENWGHHFFLF